MTVTVHYYQSAAVEANFRTMNGAHDKRISVATDPAAAAGADIVFPAAPSGATFALIETDLNIRYTVTPKTIVDAGGATLPDGTPIVPSDTSAPMEAAPFSLQGPITCEGGDIIRVKTY